MKELDLPSCPICISECPHIKFSVFIVALRRFSTLTRTITNLWKLLLFGMMKCVFCFLGGSHRDLLFACCCAKQFPFCPSVFDPQRQRVKVQSEQTGLMGFQAVGISVQPAAMTQQQGQSCSVQFYLSNVRIQSLLMWSCSTVEKPSCGQKLEFEDFCSCFLLWMFVFIYVHKKVNS